MQRQIVALVEIEAQLDWLRASLRDHCIVPSDDADADRIAQLVDSASAGVVFVRFTSFEAAPRARLVQRLLERKPRLAVIGLGETDEPDLVLQAVRAGACDFVKIGASAEEVVGALERCHARLSVDAGSAHGGRTYVVLNARPDGASASLATHIALGLQRVSGPNQRVLLVDLGMPVGDALLYLDLHASYSFTDAVRSVRRFDESLIHAAFSRHPSGLSVLPLPEDPSELESVEMADAVALAGVLNAHFDHVLINLAGFFDLGRLAPVFAQAAGVLLLVDQCLASCRANHRLLERLRRDKIDLTSCRLIVDRCTAHVEPEPGQIAELLGIPLLRAVPSAGVLMLKAMNSGQSVFEVGSGSRYVSAVMDIAQSLATGVNPRKSPLARLWSRLGLAS